MAHEEEDDMLLDQLTAEEIAELSELIDPDNDLLPASERLPPQTKKKPSGPYNREHLLEYLKKEAKESKVGEDYVPFIPKEKVPEKTAIKLEAAIKKDTYLSEFDDILAELDDAQIAEIAKELGLHGLITQDQSRGDFSASSLPSYHRDKLNKLLTGKDDDGEVEHQELTEVIDLLEQDDPSLSELNLNNHPLITSQHIFDIISALENNTHITNVSLTNVKFDDNHAARLAEILDSNNTLTSLNLDSNRITIEGIKAIMKALVDNMTLQELRLCNQYYRSGHRVEEEIAKLLEKNTTLKKFGYSFTSNGPRIAAEKWIMRNIDLQRKKRAQESI